MPRQHPVVFLSYTAASPEEREWVRALASDLRAHGVDALLDQWDLQLGDDLTKFMVEGIERADHVLLICTPTYAGKATADRGGVAFEHWIVSGAIHTGAAQPSKFLPILRAGEPSTAIPGYLRNRYFADFRDDARYGHSLEGLLRFLFNAPSSLRPELGPRPVFDAPRAGIVPDGEPRQGERASGATRPKSWILIAGTGRTSGLTDKVRATADRVGALLAQQGYGLVTGGWPGVDDISSRAFAREIDRRGLPLEDFLVQVVDERKLPSFPAGKLLFVQPGEPEWTESVGIADAIIMIGGLGGTYTSGRMALQQGKPVFPLADTDGDAKRLYAEMYRSWEDTPIRGLSKEWFSTLAREAPGVVNALPQLLGSVEPG